jgi:L-ascorbate metabolism protein UlaG (beta-lactamase superfamily)
MRTGILVLALLVSASACESKPAPRPAPEPAASAAPVAPAAPSAVGAAAATASAPKSSAGKPAVSDTLETSAGPVSITPIRHATLALGFAGKTIVVDPWSQAPAGWLPKADLVLITDIHQDHFDPKAIAEVRKADTQFVAPPVVAEKLPEAKVLKNGEKLEVLGVKVEAVPMYNLKRGPEAGKLFHDKGRGNGYLLRFGDKTLYVSGDSECTPEMKALKNVDIALLCMNLPYTMPPEEAAECVKAFKPRIVIPFHYRDSDLKVFESALSKTDGVEVRVRDFYAGGG